jgi:hypothetical protein
MEDFSQHKSMKVRKLHVVWVFDSESHEVKQVQAFGVEYDDKSVFIPECGFSTSLDYTHDNEADAVAEARENYTRQLAYFQEKLDGLGV